MTRQIRVGGVPIGGGAPVTIQSMTNTRTDDVSATAEQIKRLAAAGCEIVRVAVPDLAAARAVGEKSIELLHVAEINAVTGYIRGGCSPVGMKKQYPTVFHRTALDYETVYISAGKIGAQVELAPRALLDLLGASTAGIVVDQG